MLTELRSNNLPTHIDYIRILLINLRQYPAYNYDILIKATEINSLTFGALSTSIAYQIFVHFRKHDDKANDTKYCNSHNRFIYV